MKKMCKVFILAFLMTSMLSSIALTEDLEAMTDRFYAGLADIIERNINNPDRCLKEVYDYYQDHQALINQIRQETEKAFAQMGTTMEKYMNKYASMTEEELEALEEKRMQEGNVEPQMSPGASRYSKAIEAFIMKYPKQGSEINMKAMELLPAFNSGQ